MKTKMGKYLCEFAPDNPRATQEGYVYTHVLVAERMLGRYLTSEECVHHIDEDKYNNDLDNLMVFKTKADHSAFHKGVEAIKDGDVWCCPRKRINDKDMCPICGVNYKDYQADMCIVCWNSIKNTFIKGTEAERPRRDVLKNKIRNSNFVQIGREYSVSDNTIRKWCVAYGLPHSARVIKELSDEDWDNECFNNTK